MALQATATATSFLLTSRGVSSPAAMIPLKVGRKVCFASTNLSSISVSASSHDLSVVTHHQDGVVRPWGNFPTDIWGDRFINLPFTDSELESCSRKVEHLKKKLKDMLMSSTDDPIENILLINSLCRLGVSYHFETEIEDQLSHLFNTLPQHMDEKDHDLHIVAVIFQVFRSHGYKMPCDVFNKFKKGNGMFKEELATNIKGIISLYEASHWVTHGEHILDDALAFTTSHLKTLEASHSCPDHLKEYIGNALNFPYHKGLPRLEARNYISYYEKDDSKNDILLKFAKYDFNRVQMHHQKELSLLSSWCKNSDKTLKFPHVRHRIVESFFVAIEALFEPRFALARSVMCKWYVAITILDDTYDAYALFKELQYLSKAMKRFDRSGMDELPVDHLKMIYESILNIYDEIEEEVNQEKRALCASYFKEEIKIMAETYDVQARWTHEHIVPAFDEYLENGLRSVGAIMTMALLMMGMEEADEDAYRWLMNYDDKYLRAGCLLNRLYNDIASNEAEAKRGKVSWIACYMKEYGVSEEERLERWFHGEAKAGPKANIRARFNVFVL